MLTVLPNEQAEKIAALLTTWQNANLGKYHLFKSSFTPNSASKLADFQANEVNFTGYAPVVPGANWVTGFGDDGVARSTSPEAITFTQSGTGAIDTAGGWWQDDVTSSPTVAIACAVFDAPFQFNKTGNTLTLQASVEIPAQGDAAVFTIVGP